MPRRIPGSATCIPTTASASIAQLREHAQGERDSVEFEYRFQTAGGEYRWMQDRGRAVEWDLQGRPVLVIGVTLDIDAAKRAEAHLRSSESMLETAAWGAGIGLWETNFITDTTRWFNDWCDRHDIGPCDGADHVQRWDEHLHPDEGPEAVRSFNEHVDGKAEYYDAEYRIKTRSGAWRWVFERGRVVERDAQGKAMRMLGVCMDLDETKVAERRANARNERVEAALQLTTAGVWDWDVEHGLTHHTDGYYRVFGVDPSFGRANIMNLAAAARHRSRAAHRASSATACSASIRPRTCSKPNTASATPTAAGTGRSIAPTSWIAPPDGATRRVLGLVVDITARKLRETGPVGGRPAFPRGGARAALRDLRNRRRNRAFDRRRLSSACSATPRRSCRVPPTGRRSFIRTTSRCSSNGSTAAPNRWSRSSTASVIKRRPLRHAARLTLRGARRRGQGAAHRRRRDRHQRAGACPGSAARVAGIAADRGGRNGRLADPRRHRAPRAVHQPRHAPAVTREHHRPARRGYRGGRRPREHPRRARARS